jgi:hypothetical protein
MKGGCVRPNQSPLSALSGCLQGFNFETRARRDAGYRITASTISTAIMTTMMISSRPDRLLEASSYKAV